MKKIISLLIISLLFNSCETSNKPITNSSQDLRDEISNEDKEELCVIYLCSRIFLYGKSSLAWRLSNVFVGKQYIMAAFFGPFQLILVICMAVLVENLY